MLHTILDVSSHYHNYLKYSCRNGGLVERIEPHHVTENCFVGLTPSPYPHFKFYFKGIEFGK